MAVFAKAKPKSEGPPLVLSTHLPPLVGWRVFQALWLDVRIAVHCRAAADPRLHDALNGRHIWAAATLLLLLLLLAAAAESSACTDQRGREIAD